LFVLYSTVLSSITPPFALSSAVAAGIANADFVKVGFETVRLGFEAFFTPFVFVFYPPLAFWSKSVLI
jgi:TRAP-type uncharacterized transport system fused permease subunit